jgi:cathepsin D
LKLSGPEYKDIVTLDGSTLTVKSQTLGSATSPASPPSFPHDGLMGFAGTDESSLSAANWFNNLCTQGTLTTCRFGLAFETDNTGVQYFGEVATDRFTGSLSVASIQDEWQLSGDIALNGKVLIKDANIITDSGTTIIFGLVTLLV